ncbi:MAG: hypothetical protein K2L23_04500 [Odoribacter sp.]|nr:hypothetical protein [Odoribacter sp.]
MYFLQLRYEKVPSVPETITALVGADTVFCIFGRTVFAFRRLMKYVYALKQPVVIVHPDDSTAVYNRLKVPVGYAQENKEKVVWVNFFQRHHPESKIELIIPQEKDENIASMVRNNTAFIEQVLQKSKAFYTKSSVEESFEKNLRSLFRENRDSLLFIMRPFRIFSFYLPFHIRLFRKYAHAPVLFIPRNDALYIPCH